MVRTVSFTRDKPNAWRLKALEDENAHLKSRETLGIGQVHATILHFAHVKTRRVDAVLEGDNRSRHASVVRLQDRGDLFFRAPRLPHCPSPLDGDGLNPKSGRN